MQTVWKTQLKATDLQEVELPEGAEILFAGNQHEQICIWYRCNPLAAKFPRKIAIVGTGHAAPDVQTGRYIGSVIMHGGALVFHVFEDIRKP
jgi:hypothetical protein